MWSHLGYRMYQNSLQTLAMSWHIGSDCLPRGVYGAGGGGEDMGRLLREDAGSADEPRRRVRSGWSRTDSSFWLSRLVLERFNSSGGGANEIEASLVTAASGAEDSEAISSTPLTETSEAGDANESSSVSSRADGRGDEDGDNTTGPSAPSLDLRERLSRKTRALSCQSRNAIRSTQRSAVATGVGTVFILENEL